MDINDYIKNRVDNQIEYHSKTSAKNKKIYYILTIVQIASTIIIPVVALLPYENVKIIIAILGAIATISTTLNSTFNFKELWINSRHTSEILTTLKTEYLYNSGFFTNKENAQHLFISLCENNMNEERNKWDNIASNIEFTQ